MAREALGAVEARLSAAVGRRGAAIEAELERLGGAGGPRRAAEYALASRGWGASASSSRSFADGHGRAALRADGILRDEDDDAGPRRASMRGARRTRTLYHASRTPGDVRWRARCGLLLGRPTDMCEPPRNVYRPGAEPAGASRPRDPAARAALVTDGALDGAVVLAAAGS